MIATDVISAKVIIKVTDVNSGITFQLKGIVTVSDAGTVDSNLEILNAEKIGSKTYLISLGTIQPTHPKRMLLNVWDSQPMVFWFSISVWYLP